MHDVAPLGAVHPLPVTVAVPEATPVPTEPDTERTDVLFETNVPPLQPLGADNAVVLPALTVVGVAVTTLPVTGQAGRTPSTVEQVAAPLSQLIAYVVVAVGATDVLLAVIPASPERPLVHVHAETPAELQLNDDELPDTIGFGLELTIHDFAAVHVALPVAVTP